MPEKTPSAAPKVSVVIRTRNEESWIGHCLEMVARQDYPDFEIVVVDNESTDHTLSVVERFPVREVVPLADYRPGRALNAGIRRTDGDYIACLSAHCIPRDEGWLGALVAGFADPTIAGVYGRQLPLAFSPAIDKRDLLTLFGRDRRVQTKDYFFHNANSMIRRDVWDRIPFDETLPNIEDRHWGKAVVEAGYRLAYEPEAAVYHHHGVNQGNDPARARGVSGVLDVLDEEIATALPESLKPENCHVVAVVPVLGEPRELQGVDLFENLLRQLARSRYVRAVYAFAESETVRRRAEEGGARFIPRPAALRDRRKTLGTVLQHALGEIEREGEYPESILYVNHLCPFRPANLFDDLIAEQQYKGLDTVFPGYVDYNDHWIVTGGERCERVSVSRRPGPTTPRLFRSLYGLGCATRAAFIRRGAFLGEKVGILPVSDHIYTLRCTDQRPAPIPPEEGDGALPLGWTSEMFLREFRP